MALVSVPPFESFYEEHRNAVLGELRRLLGAQAAEDAYQETFLRYLREVYPASNPAARAVLDRVVALTAGAPELVTLIKEGERDPVSEWFSSEYSFNDFRGRGPELLDLVVDKLES